MHNISARKRPMKKLLLVMTLTVFNWALADLSTTQAIQGNMLLTGQKVVVNSMGKKGLVVVFMSAKCPCSNSHNAELIDLSNTYKDFNFAVVHSNLDEGQNISKPYFEKVNFPFPVIEDQKAEIADSLKAFKTPHAYVFNSDGKVLYEGGMSSSKDLSKADRKYLREALEDIQAGKVVRTPVGRTLGCFISRGA